MNLFSLFRLLHAAKVIDVPDWEILVKTLSEYFSIYDTSMIVKEGQYSKLLDKE